MAVGDTRSSNFFDFMVDRDTERCIECLVCIQQCPYDANIHRTVEPTGIVSDFAKCTGCHRCEAMCPTGCITIRRNPSQFREHNIWTDWHIKNLYKQAATGGVLLTGSGNDYEYPIYWDHILRDACQVTNPSIDPLREPMELRTYLGSKPDKLEFEEIEGKIELKTALAPQLVLEVPVLFSAMSYGAINLNLCEALARAAEAMGTFYNTGEGGLHKRLYKYGKNTIVQVASGRFGVDIDYLSVAAAAEIKIGQGAKPGIGGHLPGEKVGEDVSKTRMIPVGTDAISPAPPSTIFIL